MRCAVGVLCALLIASTASADDRLFRASMIAAVTAHGMDLGTTQRCLGSGRCHETNPALLRFENPVTFSAAKMGVGALGILATSKLHQGHPKWAQAINWAVAGTFSFIAIRNERVGR